MILAANAIDIPLTFYSGKNLPFGIGVDANVTYVTKDAPADPPSSKVHPFNLSMNVNSPFTLLFGFTDHDL